MPGSAAHQRWPGLPRSRSSSSTTTPRRRVPTTSAAFNTPGRSSTPPKGGAAPAPPKDEFTRIGSARVSLSERLKRLARELRPQVEPLLQDRREFDDELPRLRARFQQATAVATALDRKIPPLGEQVERFTAFFRQIEAAERVSPKAVDIQARGSLTRALARLQGRIIEATLAGDTEGAATLQDEFDRDRRQLANLEASLRGQTQKADELLTDLLSQLGALSVQLFAARKEWAQAERTRLLVGDELSRMYTRAALVSERLVALGAKLVALDFDLETVTVTANGKKAYEAQLSGPARKLQALDADIAVMKQALPELEAQRLAALQHFADSQRDAIAALESLAKTIMAVAKKKAAVDFAYNAYDVVRAASKGGLVGALAETAKKVGEALVIFVADKDKTGAKEFESLFNGNVKEAFSADKASRTGGERLAKEAISKPLKDKLSQAYLAKLLTKIYGDIGLPQTGQAAPAPTAVADRFRSFAKSFGDKQTHLANLTKGIKKPWSSVKNLKEVGGDLVGNFLKDLSKGFAKAYFDIQETEAWYAYFAADVIARTYYPLWQTAATGYWSAYDYYNGLLDQKASLLDGYSEQTNTRTTFTDRFNKQAKLLITIKVERPAGSAGTVGLAVAVGGRAAAPAGAYTYAVGVGGLPESAAGLGLEIAAR